MISEGSCDIEDWSNDTENSASITRTNLSQSAVFTCLSRHLHYTSQDPLVSTPELTPSSASRSACCFICFTCLHLISPDSSVYLVLPPSFCLGRSMLIVTRYIPSSCLYLYLIISKSVYWSFLDSACSSACIA